MVNEQQKREKTRDFERKRDKKDVLEVSKGIKLMKTKKFDQIKQKLLTNGDKCGILCLRVAYAIHIGMSAHEIK